MVFDFSLETRRVRFVCFLALLDALTRGRFNVVARGLAFCFEVRALVALRARAFPAGERLVAGFKRVDLPATTRLRVDDVVDEWREAEREDSFFTLLVTGLLMRKAPIFKDDSPHKSR